MPLYPDLRGRIALVTGGSRGIGAAICLLLADAGADVAVNYRDRGDAAETVVAAIRAKGRRAVVVKADVSKASEVAEMVRIVVETLGPITILVNNAGIALVRGIENLTEKVFDETITVNLKSAFLCTQAVLPHMKKAQWGRIVNVTSGAARGGGSVGPHYNASKAGMEGLTRGYAARLVKENITVNACAPSLIATDMMQQGLSSQASRIPVGRLGTAEECAEVVLMLIGNAYMTGQTVALSGGLSFL
ncbi:3-oxoacyl-reductase [Gonapodya prolifera JEL478]|uniref:3-oxoacyl-[acyl-carrier-protein] reductase n=1 Tax=Gonapodya prolifera (strain JEL478) TaxID=1344416 RepID=A0A139A4Y8_GONPJ|nr:3-oxoacyl-reductase [Gonapodya prolifera JEL478]|eukprot:KXS11565.1 3-oxoacyl-reductase [Gonapodya prolifera JEL478]